MTAPKNDEIIIHGTTSNGKVFRPSDWAERLCGILSSFTKDHRLSYHEFVHPMLIDKVRCVTISKQLEEVNPSMFRFLMDFAADNDLRVMTAEELYGSQKNEAQQAAPVELAESTVCEQPQRSDDIAVAEAVAELKEQQGSRLREITAEETATAFAALSVLRPMLNDINGFVEQINQVQRAQGYRLLGIFEEGKTNAVAVCGFREETNIVSGRHLHIDDFVTVPQSRGHGYATMLLDEVRRIAEESGIKQIHVDSNVSSERTVAHRLYFKHGFEIGAYHFVHRLEGHKIGLDE